MKVGNDNFFFKCMVTILDLKMVALEYNGHQPYR